ncbi:MAG: hypothetical protein Q8P25_03120 [Candidatus Curtissbacteria bacterium]|nr:hypothetical protein [Candidatus Curtissbacteria bacterium]
MTERNTGTSDGLPQGADLIGLTEIDPYHPDAIQAHYNNILRLTGWLVRTHASAQQLQEHLTGKVVMPHLRDAAETLFAANKEFVEGLQTPESQKLLARIKDRYEIADQLPARTPEQRAASRLATSLHGIKIVSDFDGTITDEDVIQMVDGVKPGFPVAFTFDVALQAVKDIEFKTALINMHPATFKPTITNYPEQYLNYGRISHLRNGVQESFTGFIEEDVPVRIITANAALSVKGTFERIPIPHDFKIWGIEADSVISAEKAAVIQKEAVDDPERAVIYIGDGASDKAAIDAKDQIAFYFALKDSRFERELRRAAGALYFTYEDWYDIKNKLREISQKVPAVGQYVEGFPSQSLSYSTRA